MSRSTWVTVVLMVVLVTLCLLPTVLQADPSDVLKVIPENVASAALEREVQVATGIGFVERERGSMENQFEKRIALEAGDCVAVVTAVAGQGELTGLWLEQNRDELARDVRTSAVLQAQLCSDVAREVRASTRAMGGWETKPKRDVKWVVLRAKAEKIGGNAALNRGLVPK